MKRRLGVAILVGSSLGLVGALLVRRQGGEVQGPPAALQAPRAPPVMRPAPGQRGFAYQRREVPQRELAPADERYNPVTLLREEELSPREVFEREPRDREFAPVFERRIRDGYSSAFEELQIGGRVVSLSVECRTLSCYTSVEVAREDAEDVYRRINGLIIGSVHEPALVDGDSPGLMKVTFYTLFEPELRDDRRFRVFMERVFAYLVRAFEREQRAEPGAQGGGE